MPTLFKVAFSDVPVEEKSGLFSTKEKAIEFAKELKLMDSLDSYGNDQKPTRRVAITLATVDELENHKAVLIWHGWIYVTSDQRHARVSVIKRTMELREGGLPIPPTTIVGVRGEPAVTFKAASRELVARMMQDWIASKGLVII